MTNDKNNSIASDGKVLVLLHPAITTKPEIVESILTKYKSNNLNEVHQFLLPKFLESFEEIEDVYQTIHFLEPQPSECDRSVIALILKISNSLLVMDGSLKGLPMSKVTKLQKKMFGFIDEKDYLIKAENKIVKPTSNTKLISTPKKEQEKEEDNDKTKFFENEGIKGDSKDDFLKIEDDSTTDINDEQDFTKTYMVKCTENDTNGKKLTRRKKACADCTCGLKELEEQELEERKKANRERIKNILLLKKDDLTEIDFTIKGKQVGGCGSCALGDAFRCDGCPYLGLPAFKPGEAINLSSIQDDLD